MHLCMCIPVYLCSLPVYLYTCVPAYLYTCLPMYLCTCSYMYLCTYVPVYMCTYVPVYLCTHVPPCPVAGDATVCCVMSRCRVDGSAVRRESVDQRVRQQHPRTHDGRSVVLQQHSALRTAGKLTSASASNFTLFLGH